MRARVNVPITARVPITAEFFSIKIKMRKINYLS